jgi:oligosaccharyltransferase complex subunit epsilon
MAPKTTPKTAPAAASRTTIENLWNAYNETTTARLKFVDAFLLFLMLSGVAQFLYCILVTNFPFNAFLAGYDMELLPAMLA